MFCPIKFRLKPFSKGLQRFGDRVSKVFMSAVCSAKKNPASYKDAGFFYAFVRALPPFAQKSDFPYLGKLICACAAASLAIGTR